MTSPQETPPQDAGRPSEDIQPALYRRVVWVLTAAFAATLCAWMLVTPVLQGPDERHHFNSVLRIHYGGGWPAPNDARHYEASMIAQDEGHQGGQPPGSGRIDADDFLLTDYRPDGSPTRITRANTQDAPLSGLVDQMTQHPPLYYAAAGGVQRLAGADGSTWVDVLFSMRIFSLIVILPLPWLLAETSRLVTGRRWIGAVCAAIPMAIPQIGHLGSVVNNDGLVISLGAAVSLGVVRLLTKGYSPSRALWTGVLLGLALLTKGLALMLVPMVALGVGASSAGSAWAVRLRRVCATLATAFVCGGFWWLINVARYGQVQPDGLRRSWTIRPDQDRDAVDYLVKAVTDSTVSFWGRFGEGDITLWVPLLVLLLLVGAFLVGIGAVRRHPGRGAVWLLLLPFLLAVAFMIPGPFELYLDTGEIRGVSGRYLFPMLSGAVAASALGLLHLSRRLLQARHAAAIVLSLVTLAVAGGLLTGIVGFYREEGEDVRAVVLHWAGWTWGGSVGVLVAALCVAGALVATILCAKALGVSLHQSLLGQPARTPQSARKRGGA